MSFILSLFFFRFFFLFFVRGCSHVTGGRSLCLSFFFFLSFFYFSFFSFPLRLMGKFCHTWCIALAANIKPWLFLFSFFFFSFLFFSIARFHGLVDQGTYTVALLLGKFQITSFQPYPGYHSLIYILSWWGSIYKKYFTRPPLLFNPFHPFRPLHPHYLHPGYTGSQSTLIFRPSPATIRVSSLVSRS